MSGHELRLGSAPSETVLPEVPAGWRRELEAATAGGARDAAAKSAVAAVAGAHPSYLAAWAALAELATEPVDAYAYARVGYHRGLDALRAAGWKGSGYVRWRQEPNEGFLRSLRALAEAAGRLGEADEAERCRLFLRQLDPDRLEGREAGAGGK